MLELVVLGVLGMAVLLVFGVLAAVAAFVWWIVVLPFKLLGLVFRGAAVLLALPFLLIAGFIGLLVFGAGVLAFMMPALPLVLLILGVVWLVRRRSRSTAHAM
ncbi:MAG: hypothetical protein E6K73_03315 [Candidatus Eisenbacteria bacterium]|uniref:Uncharacterized protein n=1 Tax=Eiseniibacteriota bacterium TaxID=2212470 RepID=A0A538SLM2_UNCEI|nr:MAG: hypothetical protein E6K73_03315 [Candidatus Eisenbacteria bacterium]